MAQSIVIVGGLSDSTEREALLGELRGRSASIEWDWIKPQTAAFNLPVGPFRRLLALLSNRKVPHPTIVKLRRLHGRDESQLFKACRDPVLAPPEIDTGAALVEWIHSRQANLVPHDEWFGNGDETALISILAKLIRNKSWNKDSQGHHWTREEDLLGQAPVYRSEFPQLARVAAALLPQLNGPLLLSKGGKQGKTPKEWSVRLSALRAVKRCIVEQSLEPLKAVIGVTHIVERTALSTDRPFRIDGDVVSERVRQVCIDLREAAAEGPI